MGQRYLDLLWTQLLGFANASCKPKPNAPRDGEPFGCKSILYVDVPMDVVMAYHRRAQAFALLSPPAQALAVLTARDGAERKAWVDRLRQNKDTLGEVMSSVSDKRGGVWIIAPEASDDARRETCDRRPSPHVSGPTADIRFCARWNAGGCVTQCPCPDGLKHRCGFTPQSGRPCNLNNHRAVHCKHKGPRKGGKCEKRQRRNSRPGDLGSLPGGSEDFEPTSALLPSLLQLLQGAC